MTPTASYVLFQTAVKSCVTQLLPPLKPDLTTASPTICALVHWPSFNSLGKKMKHTPTLLKYSAQAVL